MRLCIHNLSFLLTFRVRSCCILAPDGRFQCAYPKCPKLYASQDAVRKHCRLQHLEWLRNLQTTTSKNHQHGPGRSNESPRLQALRRLPPTEALDLLQPDDWLSELLDFDTSNISVLTPHTLIPTDLKKDPSTFDVEQIDEQAVQACIRQLSTAIRRCPSTAQSAHMLKIVRLLSLTQAQIAQLQPRERRTVLGIRRWTFVSRSATLEIEYATACIVLYARLFVALYFAWPASL